MDSTKQYNVLETFEIDGQSYEAGTVAELTDEQVGRISESYIEAVEDEEVAEAAPAEEAATEEKGTADDSATAGTVDGGAQVAASDGAETTAAPAAEEAA